MNIVVKDKEAEYVARAKEAERGRRALHEYFYCFLLKYGSHSFSAPDLSLDRHDETHINIPGGGDPEQESLLQSDEQRYHITSHITSHCHAHAHLISSSLLPRQQEIRMDDMIQYTENLIAERSKDVQSIERDVSQRIDFSGVPLPD